VGRAGNEALGVPMSWPIITDQASATTPKPRRCYSSRN
jgi:hypothetical protein